MTILNRRQFMQLLASTAIASTLPMPPLPEVAPNGFLILDNIIQDQWELMITEITIKSELVPVYLDCHMEQPTLDWDGGSCYTHLAHPE